MDDVTGMPQTAVVLGGGSDLARALLRRLAGRRLRSVLLAGRDEAALAAAAKELANLGVQQVETARFDVGEVAAHEAFATDVAARLGSIDLLVMAVGVLGTGDLSTLTAAEVAETMQANLTGPAAAMIAFAPIMRRQGHGRMVVYSSVAGVRVRRSNFVYGAAKAGLDGLSQGLGDALAGTGVEIMIVRPGFVRTKMTADRPAMPFAATADQVADAVVLGLEQRSAVVWVPGMLRWLFALARYLPRRLWRSLPG